MELTQLKEQLVMEKHSNELRLKHMMSDMEETLVVREHSRERDEAAYKVIKKALGEKKPLAHGRQLFSGIIGVLESEFIFECVW